MIRFIERASGLWPALWVERGDFSHLLSLYAPDKLPSGGRLRGMMNTMMFERLIYDRTKRVFEYFNLPFDAEPPP